MNATNNINRVLANSICLARHTILKKLKKFIFSDNLPSTKIPQIAIKAAEGYYYKIWITQLLRQILKF